MIALSEAERAAKGTGRGALRRGGDMDPRALKGFGLRSWEHGLRRPQRGQLASRKTRSEAGTDSHGGLQSQGVSFPRQACSTGREELRPPLWWQREQRGMGYGEGKGGL